MWWPPRTFTSIRVITSPITLITPSPGRGTAWSAPSGVEFHPDLDVTPVEAIFRKGQYSAAYSGFEGADEDEATLADWLRRRGVDAVDVVGIATDYCVKATAADAVAAGFTTRVLSDLTAGVSPTTTAEALDALREAGVEVVDANP